MAVKKLIEVALPLPSMPRPRVRSRYGTGTRPHCTCGGRDVRSPRRAR